ncbi:conserved exported hypothetical protein [Verrucomicrobia bacterium]|nr:conserved exported hypothetical protein [Verrucomicrobiota bacterium]
MKRSIIRISRILPRRGWIPTTAILALLLAAALPLLADDEGATDPANPGIRPPLVQTHPYGKTYGEWSAKWWQWTMAFPSDADPASNTAPPDSDQSGKVWFLATAHGSVTVGGSATVTRTLTVPNGKALFFPVLAVIDDNTGCPSYNSPLLTADQLAAQAADIFTAVSETTCTIDGVPVQGLDDPQHTLYRVQSPAFTYTVAGHSNLLAAAFGEPCIPDGTTVTPAVSDGVFLMVAPLSAGPHTIHFVGVVGPVATPFFFKDITYNITVAPGGGRGNDQE